MGLIGASVFKNPPAGYTVGGAPAAAKGDAPAKNVAGKDFTQQEALRTPQWYLLTLILTISVTAGISLISVAAGLSLIHISEPTRRHHVSRMPSSA